MKIFKVDRYKKIGISISLLLTLISATTCWVGSKIWYEGWITITLQEPRTPILIIEVITLGLVALLGVYGIIYFIRR